jgi:hypothetical protein
MILDKNIKASDLVDNLGISWDTFRKQYFRLITEGQKMSEKLDKKETLSDQALLIMSKSYAAKSTYALELSELLEKELALSKVGHAEKVPQVELFTAPTEPNHKPNQKENEDIKSALVFNRAEPTMPTVVRHGGNVEIEPLKIEIQEAGQSNKAVTTTNGAELSTRTTPLSSDKSEEKMDNQKLPPAPPPSSIPNLSDMFNGRGHAYTPPSDKVQDNGQPIAPTLDKLEDVQNAVVQELSKEDRVGQLVSDFTDIAPMGLLVTAAMSFILVGFLMSFFYMDIFVTRFPNQNWILGIAAAIVQEGTRFFLLATTVRDFSRIRRVEGVIGVVGSLLLVLHDCRIALSLEQIWGKGFFEMTLFFVLIGLLIELRLVLTIYKKKKK